ncbi:unnamed protein product [Ambrosiozyma monospora]|uniref:Unnamed protein product n=1 Tax=Ambrosiozyma monospora TaxID=43982 RepID=A0ACB5T0Y6_AMBMO|nr:unnamed protein product [Ambrosiozyma monospora]
MNKPKIDFAFLKQRREQIAKFQSIMKCDDLPEELNFSIWKTIITENLVLTDLILLVKQDCPFTKMIFKIF